ncbi:MAG: hypothetical protein IJN54_15965 [Lachnospiraceae bacterium]|nr:hypothetical protein [Lachnospiraceae bacterium]
MKRKEKRDGILGEELDLDILDTNESEDDMEHEEHHSKFSTLIHLLMAVAAIVIVVVIVSVMMLKNNPVTYNDIDASGIEVSGVYQSILEWEEGGNKKDGTEHYVENKVSITTLTEDSEVPPVLLEGVLSELHGMQICFSEDRERGYYAACFTSGNTTYLLESDEITKKQFTKAVEQFVKDQY